MLKKITSAIQVTKIFLVLALFCSACSSNSDVPDPDIKFDKAKWNTKEELNYTYRKQMINDLLKNYKWTDMKKDSVIRLLGEPDGIEEHIFMLYNYKQKHFGNFPLSTKQLVIELNTDSTVKLARIN